MDTVYILSRLLPRGSSGKVLQNVWLRFSNPILQGFNPAEVVYIPVLKDYGKERLYHTLTPTEILLLDHMEKIPYLVRYLMSDAKLNLSFSSDSSAGSLIEPIFKFLVEMGLLVENFETRDLTEYTLWYIREHGTMPPLLLD